MGEGRRVRRITPNERIEGAPTPGMVRRQAVGTEGMWAGIVLTDAGAVSGWHHHGDYETSIYLMSGGMRVEFGPGGQDAVVAQPGDFLFIAPHVVHREGNPARGQATAVVFRAGHGEPVTNVDGPEPERDAALEDAADGTEAPPDPPGDEVTPPRQARRAEPGRSRPDAGADPRR